MSHGIGLECVAPGHHITTAGCDVGYLQHEFFNACTIVVVYSLVFEGTKCTAMSNVGELG